MRKNLYGVHFCGNEASDYGKENGYLDFATFCKAFDMVLNNNIMNATDPDYWELENGIIDNSEEIEELETRLDELEIDPIENAEEIEEIEEEIEELRTEEDESYYPEVFQTFIISDAGAEIVKEYTDFPLWYNEELDMYVLGVTHYGTSWSYVLTDIKLNAGMKALETA